MANNIYIGNRYVPVFANPVEWDNLREYEALTIVTYNGTAYTSRQRVPVGTALSNTEYWVVTGNYNAQVEQYRQDVANVVSDLNDFETETAGNFTAVDTKLSKKANNLSGRKFLFVGDSYIASHSGTCVELACSSLGITNFTNVGTSGASFHDGSFLSQITNYSGNKSEITDIFVIGGLNDSIYTSPSSTLDTAIASFISYAESNYPNAHITVCFVGHAFDNASALDGRGWYQRQWARWIYSNNLAGKCTYYPDMWTALVSNVAFMNNDGIHPNAYGQTELSRFLVQYILGNNAEPIYPWFGAGGISNMLYLISNNNIQMDYVATALEISSVAGQTISGNGEIKLSETLNVYFNNKVVIPCVCRAVNANNISHQALRGYIVAEGRKLSLYLNNIIQSGFGSLTFANNGNITIDKLQFESPIINLL